VEKGNVPPYCCESDYQILFASFDENSEITSGKGGRQKAHIRGVGETRREGGKGCSVNQKRTINWEKKKKTQEKTLLRTS